MVGGLWHHLPHAATKRTSRLGSSVREIVPPVSATAKTRIHGEVSSDIAGKGCVMIMGNFELPRRTDFFSEEKNGAVKGGVCR